MKPFVILDIDQDFFFSPVINGEVDEVKEPIAKDAQRQSQSIASVVNKFAPAFHPHMELFEFDNHDSVGKLILERNLNDILLYHLDAHIDVDIDDPKNLSNEMHIGNWISATYNRYFQVYWVLSDLEFVGTSNTNLRNPPLRMENLTTLPDPMHPIDMICWTKSPEWCRQDIDLLDAFKRTLTILL